MGNFNAVQASSYAYTQSLTMNDLTT